MLDRRQNRLIENLDVSRLGTGLARALRIQTHHDFRWMQLRDILSSLKQECDLAVTAVDRNMGAAPKTLVIPSISGTCAGKHWQHIDDPLVPDVFKGFLQEPTAFSRRRKCGEEIHPDERVGRTHGFVEKGLIEGDYFEIPVHHQPRRGQAIENGLEIQSCVMLHIAAPANVSSIPSWRVYEAKAGPAFPGKEKDVSRAR